MPHFALFAVKLTLLFTFTFAAARLLRKNSAATRHATLLAGIVAVLALPLASAVLPSIGPVFSLQREPPQAATATANAALELAPAANLPLATQPADARPRSHRATTLRTAAQTTTTKGAVIMPLLLALWLAGTLLMLVRLAASHWRMHRVARTAHHATNAWQTAAQQAAATYGMAKPPLVLTSVAVDTPLAAGLRTPFVVVPAAVPAADPAHAPSLNSDDINSIMMHECAHLARHDQQTLLLAELVRALYWWHPLAHVAASQLRQLCERAADDRVLAAGARASDYAAMLVAMCRATTAWPSAAQMGANHGLQARIDGVLAANAIRTPARWQLVAATMTAVTTLVACVGQRPQSVTPKANDNHAATSAAAPAAIAATSTTAAATSTTTTSTTATTPGVRTLAPSAIRAIVDREANAWVKELAPRALTVVVMNRKRELLAQFSHGTIGLNPAGSTIKPLVIAAALDAGIPATQRYEFAPINIDGTRIEDAQPIKQGDLADIVLRSSNVGAAKLGAQLGAAKLHRALTAFRVDQFPINAPAGGEMMPLPAPNTWTALMTAKFAIGNGVRISPLGLAEAYAVLANGGSYSHDITGEAPQATSGGQTIVVQPASAHAVLGMMERVVADPAGTGTRAAIANVRVAGKTGTTPIVDAQGKAVANRWWSSFVGVFPAEAPEYIIVVAADVERTSDYSGGIVAAPLFARIGAALSGQAH